jgi:hypothetical protein
LRWLAGDFRLHQHLANNPGALDAGMRRAHG